MRPAVKLNFWKPTADKNAMARQLAILRERMQTRTEQIQNDMEQWLQFGYDYSSMP